MKKNFWRFKRILKRLDFMGSIILFVSSFFFIFEILVAESRANNNIYSIWSFIALAYLILTTRADIQIIIFIGKTNIWKKIVDFGNRVWGFLKRVWEFLKRKLLSKRFMEKLQKRKKNKKPGKLMPWLIAWLKALGYLGLVICTATVNLGRVGATIYVAERKKMPYGRWYLYLGCLIRFFITYGFLNLF